MTNGLITNAIKLTIKLKNYCSYNKEHFVVATTNMLMRAATVAQQVRKSCRTCFKFYCMFYFTCDRSFSPAYKAGSLRTPRFPGTKPTYRPLPHKCETHITSVYHHDQPGNQPTGSIAVHHTAVIRACSGQ